MPSPRSRYEAQGFNNDIQSWGSARGSWGAPGQSQDSSFDGSSSSPWPIPQPTRNGTQILLQSDKHVLEEREGYDIHPESEHLTAGAFADESMHFTIRPPTHGVEFSNGGMQHLGAELIEVDSKNAPVRLLALPEDRISLSETLCIVREVGY